MSLPPHVEFAGGGSSGAGDEHEYEALQSDIERWVREQQHPARIVHKSRHSAHKGATAPIAGGAPYSAAHAVPHLAVSRRPEAPHDPVGGRDLDFAALVADRSTLAAAEPLAATAPLYTLYTSGTTGEPKGILRDNAHAVQLQHSMRTFYDVAPGETFWASSSSSSVGTPTDRRSQGRMSEGSALRRRRRRARGAA